LGWNGNSFVDSVGAREFVYILDSTYGEDEDYEYDPFSVLMEKTLYYIRMAGKPDRHFLNQCVSINIEPDPGLTEADVFRFRAQVTDADEKLAVAPVTFQLHPNYPNPFNALTTLNYNVLRESHIQIGIYDILGRNVETLVDEKREAGHHRVTWDATYHATGVYIAVMRAGESLVMTRKMLLLK
ncbi:T9SS type A sorting domain-containing protein, partial [candidate division KSB1 bacterium]